MGFWLFAGTIWIAMLGYSIMSAIFGFNKLRRIYLDLLRMLYRVRGGREGKIESKEGKRGKEGEKGEEKESKEGNSSYKEGREVWERRKGGKGTRGRRKETQKGVTERSVEDERIE